MYNAIVIYANRKLSEGTRCSTRRPLYPTARNLERRGQTRYQAKDFKGASWRYGTRWGWIRKTLPTTSSCSFPARNRGQENSVAEYTIYKALSQERRKITPSLGRLAVNRLGAQNQLIPTLKPRATPTRSIPTRREQDLRDLVLLVQGEIVHVHGRTDFLERPFPAKKSS